MKFSQVFTALPLLPEAGLAILRGRNRLAKTPAKHVIEELEAGTDLRPSSDGPLLHRISNAIRIAARLAPWRSDCLVQAMAAKSMLAARGLPSSFYIGVSRGEGQEFTAHAWLKSGGRIVVGGDVSGFTPLIEPPADVQQR